MLIVFFIALLTLPLKVDAADSRTFTGRRSPCRSALPLVEGKIALLEP